MPGAGIGLRALYLSALLLLGVLWQPCKTDACVDPVDVGEASSICQSFHRVCLDHDAYIMYDAKYNPRHAKFQPSAPRVRLEDLRLDYFGFNDRWGTEFAYPQPLMRPATSGEETPELREPRFSRCTVPVIIYSNYLYQPAEFFLRTVATVHALQRKGVLHRK
jgi:hypothetical protein